MVNKATDTELVTGPADQLYDLAADPGQTQNVAAKHAESVKEMKAMLQKIKEQGGR